jgi:hypothetical protein
MPDPQAPSAWSLAQLAALLSAAFAPPLLICLYFGTDPSMPST